MKKLALDSINERIEAHKMVLLYFGSKTCGVCTVIKTILSSVLAVTIERLLLALPSLWGQY